MRLLCFLLLCVPIVTHGKQIKIELQVYRHGFSCSNLIGDCTKCQEVKRFVPDAIVNDYGIRLTKKNGKNGIPQPDVVMASTLVRAIQTALYQFPSAIVYAVPFIKENSSTPPDMPTSVADQKKVIRRFDGAAAERRVDFGYTTREACRRGSSAPRCRADWPDFLNWLGRTLVDNPPNEVAERIDGGDPIEIAIITHGLLIRRQILEEPDSEVSNDQGFSASFTLDTETGRLKQNRAWKDIDESPGSRNTCKARAGLKPSDYARCERRYPAAWDRLGRKSCI